MDEYLRFNVHGNLGVAVGAYDLALGLFVLLQNPTGRLNRLFSLVTLTTSVWITTFGLISLVKNPDDAYLWVSASYLGIPFISLAMYAFTAEVAGRKIRTSNLVIGLACGIPALILMVAFPSALCSFQENSWGRYPRFLAMPAVRSYYAVLVTTFLYIGVQALGNLIYAWRRSISPYEKKRLGIMLAAFCLSYVGAVDWIAALGFSIYPPGYLAMSAHLTLITYAIFRHRAFEINVMVRRLFSVAIIYAILFAISIPIAALILHRMESSDVSRSGLLVLVLSCFFGLILSSGPVIYMYLMRHAFWLRNHASAGLVHELRSPIATIQGALEVLAQTVTPVLKDDKATQYLDLVRRSTDRLELFVTELLQLARIQDADVLIEKREMDLSGVVLEVIDSYQVQAERKNIYFTLSTHEVPLLNGDVGKLRQVVSNLISNAVKYSEKGEIKVTIGTKNGMAVFAISDSGKGIEVVDHERVFERFFQGDGASKGAGLGLTIARAWISAHGGQIWLQSDGRGKGTTVTFTLPLS